jgi:hypothetical protein
MYFSMGVSMKNSRRKASAEELEDAMGVVGVEPQAPLPRRKGRQFLFGPLDWLELCLVAKLGGAALEVWLLLHLRWRMHKELWVSLPNQKLAEMGVNRSGKQRALARLESEGLIRIAPQVPGKTALVALVREERR